jgi:hypothetical protein
MSRLQTVIVGTDMDILLAESSSIVTLLLPVDASHCITSPLAPSDLMMGSFS